MGRKSNKGKEKKMKKKEESVKLAVKQALVDAANAQEDPLAELLPFKKFDRNGLNVSISCQRVGELDKDTVEWAFQLTKANMQALYESSEWGWSDSDKREEMTDEKAWYLIAKDLDNNSLPVAMVHFRFDIDNDDEVLYCYEIQLSSSVRRKGLGKFLMQILELLAFKSRMIKVMVTVFKHNSDAQEFFGKKLKYAIDETSPEDYVEDALFSEASTTYQILSKPIGVRQSTLKSPAAVNGNANFVPSAAACGGNHCHHH